MRWLCTRLCLVPLARLTRLPGLGRARLCARLRRIHLHRGSRQIFSREQQLLVIQEHLILPQNDLIDVGKTVHLFGVNTIHLGQGLTNHLKSHLLVAPRLRLDGEFLKTEEAEHEDPGNDDDIAKD